MVYLAFLTAPLPWILGALSAWLLLPLVLLPLAVALVRVVRTHTDGPTLNGALARTGMLAARLLRAALGGVCCRADGRPRRLASR